MNHKINFEYINSYAIKFKYEILNQYYNCTTWVAKNPCAHLIYKTLCDEYSAYYINKDNTESDSQVIFGLFALFIYCYYNGYNQCHMHIHSFPFSINFSTGAGSCKKNYPLYDRSKVPSPGEIIAHFVPHEWLIKAKKAGHTDSEFISNCLDKLDKINNVLSVFDPTQGSKYARATKSILTIAVSAAAAVGTEGTVGSNIANIPKYMAKGISMISKMIDKLVTIINDINTVLQTAETVLDIADHLEDDALSPNKSRKINDTQQQLNFLYDMFNVDFRGGPFHCRCWVKYLVKLYMGSETERNKVKALFCMINDIYVSLNAEILGFIGSTLDVLIPDAMGLFGIASQFVGKYSYEIYKTTLKGLVLAYSNVPNHYKNLIQHPTKFKKFVFHELKKYTFGLSKIVMTKKVKYYVTMALDVVSHALYKGISLTFVFLNLFVIFSELQAGIYKLDPKKMFNAKQIDIYCSNVNDNDDDNANNDDNANENNNGNANNDGNANKNDDDNENDDQKN